LTHKFTALLPMLLHFPHVDVDAAVQVARVVAVAAAPAPKPLTTTHGRFARNGV